MDGVAYVSFYSLPADNYYVAISHRNHLGIRTQNTVALSYSPLALTDFTSSSTQIYGNILSGTINQIYSGDTNSSGVIDASDRSGTWNNRNQVGYLIFDCNLNGTVDAGDRAFTWNNRNKTNN